MKYLTVSIFLINLFHLFPINSYAQNVLLELPNITAQPGDEIVVDVTVVNAVDLMGFRVVIDLPNFSNDFPVEYIEDSSTVRRTLAHGWIKTENDQTKDSAGSSQLPGAFLINGAGFSAIHGSGTFLQFTLKIKDDATPQYVPLNFRLEGERVTRLNDGALPFVINNGWITIGDLPPPTPTPMSDATPTVTPTPTSATPMMTVTPSPTSASATFTPSPSPTINETPSPTPTDEPTPTPTPVIPTIVTVTDIELSFEDLSNGVDHDDVDERKLVIKWDFSLVGIDRDELREIHINVLNPQTGQYEYLGRTPNGNATAFVWERNSPRTDKEYRDGPQFFQNYEFRLFGIRRDGGPSEGPYPNAGPITFLPLVTVTDDETTLEDISGGEDFDLANDRALVIRWNPDPPDYDLDNVADYQVFVRVNGTRGYQFLGRTRDPDVRLLVWRQNAPGIDRDFDSGPLFNNRYEFRVFAIREQGPGRAYGPFEPNGSIGYGLGIDPSPTVTPTQTNTPTNTATPTHTLTPAPRFTPTPTNTFVPSTLVTVTDDENSTTDLSGQADHDPLHPRELVVRWDLSIAGLSGNDFRDIHIYVQSNVDDDYSYLGRTGSGEATNFRWRSGFSFISFRHNGGPQFNHSYRFRVIPIPRGNDDLRSFDNAAPVLFLPMITVTDDGSSLNDLSNATDFDNSNDRKLTIRWEPDPTDYDTSSVTDYHIYVFENSNFLAQFLGRTRNADARSYTWEENAPFVSDNFEDGPQFGNQYRFLVFPLKNGFPPFFGPYENAGAVSFETGEDPTFTPTPIVTPSPTFPHTPIVIPPTPTFTPVIFNTPTNTPTPSPRPITLSGRVRTLFGGQPIPDALVSANGFTTLTNQSGSYELGLPGVGLYTIDISADNFRTFSTTLLLVRDQTLNIRLFPGSNPTATPTPVLYSISGFVFDGNSFELIENAVVTISGENETTDSNGFYFFGSIPPGEYTVRIEAPGYQTHTETITINENTELVTPLTPL